MSSDNYRDGCSGRRYGHYVTSALVWPALLP